MDIIFPDIYKHPAYLQRQSKAWCNQLAAQTGRYEYPWNYSVEGQSAEEVFTDKLNLLIRGGRVLDVGCGHGEYTSRWSEQADEVYGYDMTEGFLETANRNRKANVHYVLGYTKEQGLPFPDQFFDVAYTKKGPGSWYPEANRILKPGADVLGLHPLEVNGNLALVFPGLFSPVSPQASIQDKVNRYVAQGLLHIIKTEILHEINFIPTAEDILAMVCFGQSAAFVHDVKKTCFDLIQKQFDRYRTKKGLQVTGCYYLIHARATD